MPHLTVKQAMEVALQHQQAGRLQEAAAFYKQILSLRPDDADAMHMLGVVQIQLGKPGLSLDYIRHAIEINPRNPHVYTNLGEAMMRLGRPDEAINCFRQSLSVGPALYETWNNMGNALGSLGRLDEAIDAYRNAIALRPNLPEAHSNLGDALRRVGKFLEAKATLERALAIAPNLVPALNNLGTCLRSLGRYDEAIAAYRHALTAAPEFATLHYNLGVTLLLKGDFAEGFAHYEQRWAVPELRLAYHRLIEPVWGGEPLADRTLLLHAEQGLGDTIQMVRYIPLLADRGGRIVLQVPVELHRLLKDLRGVDRIIGMDDRPSDVDVHCPLMSIPLLTKTTLATLPHEFPYLQADSEQTNRWRDKIGADVKQLKVGLVWAGRHEHPHDRERSISLGALAPLMNVANVRFISLQTGEAATVVSAFPSIDDGSIDLKDFSDTAGLIQNLDLLISVDTAAAHLAGAMNKPAWVLIPFSPDWRWMIDRTDSPWYPSLKLFRQSSPGDWNSPIARMTQTLQELAKAKS